MKIDFCLPAKNEEKIIVANVRRLEAFLKSKNWSFIWRIVVIVNGSSDSSWAAVQKLQSDNIKIKQIKASGRGRALKSHFSTSLADILVYMDVDLAVSLDNIPALITPLLDGKTVLTIGSRMLPTSKIVRSNFRKISSRLYNSLSRLILRHNSSDLQCGFKAIKRPFFKKIERFLHDDYWFFDTELVVISKKMGYKVEEIAVNWQENRYEERKSKVNVFKDGCSSVINLLALRLRLFRIKQ